MDAWNGLDPTGALNGLLRVAHQIETLAQLQVLRLLDANRGAQPSQLSDALGCTRGNVTGIVNRLQRQGLIRRQHSEQDRRVVHLYLTSEGVDLAGQADGISSYVSRRLRMLSESELKALKQLLAALQLPPDGKEDTRTEGTDERTRDERPAIGEVGARGVVVVKKSRTQSIRIAPRKEGRERASERRSG